jgi:hypothetical protein
MHFARSFLRIHVRIHRNVHTFTCLGSYDHGGDTRTNIERMLIFLCNLQISQQGRPRRRITKLGYYDLDIVETFVYHIRINIEFIKAKLIREVSFSFFPFLLELLRKAVT